MIKKNRSKNYFHYIVGAIFFIIGVIWVNNLDISAPMITPAQVVGSSKTFAFEGITSELLAVQEVILTKDYLQGVELRMTNFKRSNTNENIFFVLDSNYNVVFRDRFSSVNVVDGGYFTFKSSKSIRLGRGSKIYLCIYSDTGVKDNCISFLFNPEINAGKLYACKIRNNDVIGSVRNKARLYPGSLIMRIYESDASGTEFFKLIFYLLAFAGSTLIIFHKRIVTWISRINLKPERPYFLVSLIFGLIMVFVTPPLQSPDEATHLERSYMLSEGRLTASVQTFPASIVKLNNLFSKLFFNADEKTSKKEILAALEIKLEPTKRLESETSEFVIPYIPQTTGIFFGRIFDAPPLILMYIARIMNLLTSIILVYFAIKTAPFFKWIFFLIGAMPKTLFLFASASKDGFTISISLLLISMFLFYSFGQKERLGARDYCKIFFFTILSTISKVPNVVLVFLFTLIPVKKIGSVKKQLLVFLTLLVVVLIPFLLGSSIRQTSGDFGSLLKNAHSTSPASKENLDTSRIEKRMDASSNVSIINPKQQLKYVLDDIPRFILLEIKTNFSMQGKKILDNFVGVFGWLDTFLPQWLINGYLMLLLLAAFVNSEPGMKVGWRSRIVLLLIFISALTIIELGMYLASTTVGDTVIYGIQGRYFIQFAPLLLLLFYNQRVGIKLNFILSHRKSEYNLAKIKDKPKIFQEIICHEQNFTRTFNFCVFLFSVFALIATVYTLELRYYSW